MDRAFTVPGHPAAVWPWFVQLGKNRAGWYLPRGIERLLPVRGRGLRRLDPELQDLHVGAVIDDWGGRDAYFEVAIFQPPNVLVHRSTRGRVEISWAIVLRVQGREATRVHLRLRMAPIRRRFLVGAFGGLVDALTVAGLAAGLRERLQDHGARGGHRVDMG